MADIYCNSGDSLATKVGLAVSGDNVIVEAGATFDLATPVTLHNHGSSSNPITIKSANLSSLPAGRITGAPTVTTAPDTSITNNMPRIRATGSGGAFADVAGGSYWKLDGLEITDNTSTNITILLDLRNGGKTTFHHCYVHPKETNPTWNRYLRFAIWYEGSAGLEVKYSDFRGFLGYNPANGTEIWDSRIVLSVGGQNVTVEDNFVSAWYATFFTGGGDTAPTHTTTMTGTPTLSTATFTDTTDIAIGTTLRFNLNGSGTFASGVFTQTSGTALTDSDIGSGGYGTAMVFNSGASGYIEQLYNTTGNVYTFFSYAGGQTEAGAAEMEARYPNGSYTFTIYEMAQVTNIAGSVITYNPLGLTPLAQAPTAANATVSWCAAYEGVPAHWVIRKNTIWIDPVFAAHAVAVGGNDAVGKGVTELKSLVDLVMEGNYICGYPNNVTFPAYNQQGSSPWSRVEEITFRNNYFNPDVGPNAASSLVFQLLDPYHTSAPGGNILVYNNLIKSGQYLVTTSQGDNVQFYHNTVINDGVGLGSYAAMVGLAPVTNWVFRDNIVAYSSYGATCGYGALTVAACWPSGTWSNNVVVDIYESGMAGTEWGGGAMLSPIASEFVDVGFTDQAGGNYRLLPSSNYYHQGTSDADPGIDQDALEAALGFSISGGELPPNPEVIVRANLGMTVI